MIADEEGKVKLIKGKRGAGPQRLPVQESVCGYIKQKPAGS